MTTEPVAREPTAERSLERRIVSVLFADLVGFTSLSEALDPEDVATVQDAYFAAVRDTIARYGGVVEKFIGDAVMAVFGIPRARDDDAERAVRAGLALIGAVERLGATLGREEIALRLRVGVNSGEVVASEGSTEQGRVTGDAVNVAARFQAAAAPGSVLVGEGTALAVAEAIELDPKGAIELKGKGAPVPAWGVVAVRPERSRDAAMGRLRALMVGRDAELAELKSAVARVRGAAAERWLIVAPPGTGKSRLVSEFGNAPVRDGEPMPAIWKARSRPDLIAPYDVVAQLLAAAIATSGADPSDLRSASGTVRDALLAVETSPARTDVVVEEVLALLHQRGGGPATTSSLATERDIRFEAWRDALDALAGTRTAVWVVEDVHWAGGDLLAFLESGTVDPPAHGRLIVATARPSILESAPAFAADPTDEGRAGGRVRTLHLAALSRSDASELVRALVGDALPPELARQVADRADGNPLFIEELLRTWVSVGTLVEEDGGWRLTADSEVISLPSTVQAIYAAQLDDLSPEARTVARRASVAGRRFPSAALASLDVARPTEGIDALARRAFVSGPVPDPLAGASWSYRHALLRDAGYASLARAERARLHVRMARWLEDVAATRADDVAELIGGHYAAALESAPALAPDVGEGLGRTEASRVAAAWFERGGDRAVALAAHDAARKLLRRALDLTPDSDRLDAARRWLRLGEATAFTADMNEGRRGVERAMELYRVVWADRAASQADRETARDGLSRASWTLGQIAYQQIRFLECRDLGQQVLDEVGDRDDLPTARLLVQRGLGHYGETDEVEAATRDLERGLAIAERLGDVRLELAAREAIQYMRLEHGDTRLEPWQRIRSLAEHVGDWEKVVRVVAMPATVGADDHAAEARGPNDEARSVAEAHGLTEQIGWADYRRSELDLTAGAWDGALASGLRAVELAEANGYRRLGVRTFFVVTVIAAQRGDLALGERCRGYFDALEGPMPDSPYARVMRAGLDLYLSDLGLREPFVPEVDARVASFSGQPMGLASFCAATERIFQAWLDHDLDGAGRIMPVIAGSAALPGSTELSRATADLLRARLLAATGRPVAEVAVAARSSLQRARSVAAPWWVAKATRTLEAAGSADPQLIAEADALERGLGIARLAGPG